MNWKKDVFIECLSSSPHHEKCLVFLEAVKMAKRIHKDPTGKQVASRRRAVAGFTDKEFDSVVRTLKGQGKIITREVGNHTRYYPVKDGENIDIDI
jgi:hypothetical protein